MKNYQGLSIILFELLTSQIHVNTSPDSSKPFSLTLSAIELQTMILKPVSAGVCKGFFQILI